MAEHLLGGVEAVDQRAELHDLAVSKAHELRAPVADGPSGAGVDRADLHEARGPVAVDQELFHFHLGQADH